MDRDDRPNRADELDPDAATDADADGGANGVRSYFDLRDLTEPVERYEKELSPSQVRQFKRALHEDRDARGVVGEWPAGTGRIRIGVAFSDGKERMIRSLAEDVEDLPLDWERQTGGRTRRTVQRQPNGSTNVTVEFFMREKAVAQRAPRARERGGGARPTRTRGSRRGSTTRAGPSDDSDLADADGDGDGDPAARDHPHHVVLPGGERAWGARLHPRRHRDPWALTWRDRAPLLWRAGAARARLHEWWEERGRSDEGWSR